MFNFLDIIQVTYILYERKSYDDLCKLYGDSFSMQRCKQNYIFISMVAPQSRFSNHSELYFLTIYIIYIHGWHFPIAHQGYLTQNFRAILNHWLCILYSHVELYDYNTQGLCRHNPLLILWEHIFFFRKNLWFYQCSNKCFTK